MNECQFYSDATRRFDRAASLTDYKADLLEQAKRCNRTAAFHSALQRVAEAYLELGIFP